MAERAPDRLLRLLGMIAYLERHGGVPVEELAEQFQVSRRQVVDDVDTLWLTGTPGYWPHDLIDFDAAALEQGVVRVTQSRGMTRPLRLGTREAIALVAALRAMRESLVAGLDPDRLAVLQSVLDKLTAATGEAATIVDVRLAADGAPAVNAAVGAALQSGRRLKLDYVTAADVSGEREVDPLRLVTGERRTYLVAWCWRARAERLFRMDRVLSAEVLEVPVAEHPRSDHEDTFHPDQDAELVTLELESRARWVAETVPVEAVRNRADGSFEVDLRVVEPTWLRHLLLQVAGDVRGVRPTSVAVDVAHIARSALDAYGTTAPGRASD
ncbi:MAG TPA: WYL domain-containing protein [Cellulomonadaceae bacterium]|nr:WYL domain-containing protein [Cellulomonadaceae bacterium]